MTTTSVAVEASTRHPLILEKGMKKQAKAGLRNLENPSEVAEIERFWKRVGLALSHARAIVGWTQDELAGQIAEALGRERFDPAQVARWESGNSKDRPQFVLFAIRELHWPLIQTLAAMDDNNELVTSIRRRA